jgi:hypothetical protein
VRARGTAYETGCETGRPAVVVRDGAAAALISDATRAAGRLRPSRGATEDIMAKGKDRGRDQKGGKKKKKTKKKEKERKVEPGRAGFVKFR